MQSLFGTTWGSNSDLFILHKNCLDKYWSNEDVLSNLNDDSTGTGSLPICM